MHASKPPNITCRASPPDRSTSSLAFVEWHLVTDPLPAARMNASAARSPSSRSPLAPWTTPQPFLLRYGSATGEPENPKAKSPAGRPVLDVQFAPFERVTGHGEHPFLSYAGRGCHLPSVGAINNLLLLAEEQKGESGFAYWLCLTPCRAFSYLWMGMTMTATTPARGRTTAATSTMPSTTPRKRLPT